MGVDNTWGNDESEAATPAPPSLPALPRAQSRLELLSNTASVIEKTSSSGGSSNSSSGSSLNNNTTTTGYLNCNNNNNNSHALEDCKSPTGSVTAVVPSLLSSVSLDKMMAAAAAASSLPANNSNNNNNALAAALRSPNRTHSFDDAASFFSQTNTPLLPNTNSSSVNGALLQGSPLSGTNTSSRGRDSATTVFSQLHNFLPHFPAAATTTTSNTATSSSSTTAHYQPRPRSNDAATTTSVTINNKQAQAFHPPRASRLQPKQSSKRAVTESGLVLTQTGSTVSLKLKAGNNNNNASSSSTTIINVSCDKGNVADEKRDDGEHSHEANPEESATTPQRRNGSSSIAAEVVSSESLQESSSPSMGAGSFFPSWSGVASATGVHAATVSGGSMASASTSSMMRNSTSTHSILRMQSDSPVGLPLHATNSSSSNMVHHNNHAHAHQHSMDALLRENAELKQALAGRDVQLQSLLQRLEEVEERYNALQQEQQHQQQQNQQNNGLPTRKISQIPIADMLRLMREYGSEVSDVVMPPRKEHIQRASVVRQFRRWNPNFFEYFHFQHGSWQPKLGHEGEIARRIQTRQQKPMPKRKDSSSTMSTSAHTKASTEMVKKDLHPPPQHHHQHPSTTSLVNDVTKP